MNTIYMERHDAKQNMHRFYHMFVTPGLFDDWSLVKEWGRVGSPGTVRKDWFDCEEAAEIAGQKIRNSKMKKGYQLK
jgi:predicted DNA-binding WGR domain protein